MTRSAAGTTAVVVGSGPGGLAAAVTLAAAGCDVTVLEAAATVGGGLRSGELTLPGLVHDHCAGFHPLAVDNAFTGGHDLAGHGLAWARAPIEMAHPLADGTGAVVERDLATTLAGIAALSPRDARTWQRLFGPAAAHWDAVRAEIAQPVVHLPRHPLTLASFGVRATAPAALVARAFEDPRVAALWLGIAAHGFRPPSEPFTSAAGLALGTAAHVTGWPVAVGGSQRYADALVGVLRAHGGRVETGHRVTSLAELRAGTGADLVLLDTSPRDAARILGNAQPDRLRRRYAGWRHLVGAFGVSLAVEGGIPWAHEPSRRAAVVHVGGTPEVLAASARAVRAGRVPVHPFVLVGQQAVADPGRGRDGVVPVDAYAHVPAGHDGDLTALVMAELEAHAPGLRDRVRAVVTRTPAETEREGINFVDGDISTGAVDVRQLLLGPRPGRSPYPTGVPGVYLCSAATAPGPGAHGLTGYGAARRALADLAGGRA
ncbi:phytoene dehydrogenase-like protein [Nocardioides zeae]|uniref:Phytoene dehydrogenase-like protein n=1 Tax=Nocardioides zeae TaxID=1457234 RepID=A0ACC6IDZ9_9ACTN|nr:NAD(P)/FAD-dependent oxidoreductase [Nocardioides zeae]MDR6175887.1 phytoene dehydrogenase-like protein [Nocardioides zeae]MDR6208815.1 phytoene dehydrogenase-like protein [Nocardioides zeae]